MDQSDFLKQTQLAQYEFEVDILAPASQVWRALTVDIDSWWLPSFHMLGESSKMELEAYAGGRLMERVEGRELLWYQVIAIDTGKSIDLAGYCTAKYGGPATTLLSVEITSTTDRFSKLRVSDSLLGLVTQNSVRCACDGWKQLFYDGLKKHAEK
jgi:uncharacterized protein YndB with AHSA1/START domain